MGDLIFKNVPFEDLEEAINIEMQGFPPDEAATIEAFQLRQTLATDLFLGAYRITDGEEHLVGYICSTLAEGSSLTHDSMSTHVPDASSVCIHSVCVSSTWQRQGVGLKLLREYIARLETENRERFIPYRRVLLITHEILRHFYEMAGFEWVGPSTVHHGPESWYEMRLTLGLTPPSSDPAHIRGHLMHSNGLPTKILSRECSLQFLVAFLNLSLQTIPTIPTFPSTNSISCVLARGAET